MHSFPGGRGVLTLLPSAARTASGTSTYRLGDAVRRLAVLLDVTAAATAAGDTLDVYLQRTPDDGTTWDDFAHFTQVLGNGGAKQFQALWCADVAVTSGRDMAAPRDGSMAAGTVQGGPLGPAIKIKWTIASATAPSFTFSVTAEVE